MTLHVNKGLVLQSVLFLFKTFVRSLVQYNHHHLHDRIQGFKNICRDNDSYVCYFGSHDKNKLRDNIHNNTNAISGTKTATMFRKFIDLCFPSDVDALCSVMG